MGACSSGAMWRGGTQGLTRTQAPAHENEKSVETAPMLTRSLHTRQASFFVGLPVSVSFPHGQDKCTPPPPPQPLGRPVRLARVPGPGGRGRRGSRHWARLPGGVSRRRALCARGGGGPSRVTTSPPSTPSWRPSTASPSASRPRPPSTPSNPGSGACLLVSETF